MKHRNFILGVLFALTFISGFFAFSGSYFDSYNSKKAFHQEIENIRLSHTK